MTDSRVRNLAKIPVQTSTRVQPEDRVMIRGFPLEPVAEPLLKEMIREILRAGGFPHLLMKPSGYAPLFLNEANEAQLEYIDPFVRMTVEDFEVDIRITSSTNTRALEGRHRQRMGKKQQASRQLVQRWTEPSASGELR